MSNKDKVREAIIKKIKEVKGYIPRVGIFGTTGVGKSSLCNALFGREVAAVSNIAACTRNIQELHIAPDDGNEGGITILDFPGVGETIQRDEEYFKLYQEKIETLDLVVWVIKSDERAYTISQKVYQDILLPNIEKCPVIFFINQIDKIEPTEDEKGNLLWDKNKNVPTKEQDASVNKKIIEVSKAFRTSADRIIPTSVKKMYNISVAMEAIIDVLPKEKKYALYREAGEKIKTEKMAEAAEKGVWDTVKVWAGEAWGSIKEQVVEVISAALVSAGTKIIEKIKFW